MHRFREQHELTSLLARRAHAGLSLLGAPPRSSEPERLPPSVGDVLSINTATTCDAAPRPRAGRVVAVTQRAIAVVDEDAPAGGFTEEALTDFAGYFDDVYPVLTGTFGDPSDVDANDRVLLFFTPATEELGVPGSGVGFVGGYFWGGDLFPAAGAESCPNSSEAEVLYLAVPGPGRPVESLFTRVTIAHEFQHLVNASRRIIVTDAEALEAVWLNEALSYIAEEVVFYDRSGLRPRSNIGESELRAADAVDVFNEFGYNNIGRYNVFLLGPHFHSLMGADGTETRGAAWSFLRYALDRAPEPDDVIPAPTRRSHDPGSRELARRGLDGCGGMDGRLGREAWSRMTSWMPSIQGTPSRRGPYRR